MKKSDFYFELPEELIAQTPLEKRDSSRMLVLYKKTGTISHNGFKSLLDYVNTGDCLVFNNSKVLPARLYGQREDTKAAVEILLLSDKGENIWECLVKPGKKCKEGIKLTFGDGSLKAEIKEITNTGNRLIKFCYTGIFLEILEKLGQMPLPPYIKERLTDKDRYQTVYSKETGSAAAPTAGLHFTEQMLKELEDKGVECAFLTLHVGLSTFRPVKAENINDHTMHSEFYSIDKTAADKINNAKKAGKRVIAVGTTSLRTIESVADEKGFVNEKSGWTDIFIYPGYTFKTTDALLTNFHLPESTLIMLVSALAGKENVLNAYKEAIEQKYRFFSFGDCMLII